MFGRRTSDQPFPFTKGNELIEVNEEYFYVILNAVSEKRQRLEQEGQSDTKEYLKVQETLVSLAHIHRKFKAKNRS